MSVAARQQRSVAAKFFESFLRLPNIATVALTVILSACGGNVTDLPDLQGARRGAISWFLPRTEIRVDATFQLMECTNTPTGGVLLDVKSDATLTEVPIVDQATQRFLLMENLQGWRTANTVHVTSWDPDGMMIKSFGNKSEDKTGDIIANIATTAVKLASSAFAVPVIPAPPEAQARCGSAKAKVSSLKGAKDTLAGPTPTTQAASDAATLTDQLTIKVTKTFDPTGIIPAAGGPSLMPEFAVSPTQDQLVKYNWVQPSPSGALPLPIVYLFALRGDGKPGSPVPQGQDERPLPDSAHYRDPAIITIIAADEKKNELQRVGMAFGQFGIPRSFPLTAGLFQSWDIAVTFAKDGRQTDTTVTTTAAGVSASAALEKAVEAAGSIQTAANTAAAARTENAKSIAHNKEEADVWTAYNNCIAAKSPNCKLPPSQ